ncbi:MAG TPA: GNAT family N-acetyltransferase [Xanthobacteraceae bacterium]|jgi:GNAT superfamily N-acetyltransferase
MSQLTPWVEAAIAAHHDRKRFDCGDEALNVYLQRYARQNHESGGAKCFVVVESTDPARVLGFYTLSPASLAYARTPEIVRRGLGRYEVPVFRLGRLATDLSVQGRGLGGQLILAAGQRALLVAEHVGGVALLIDAKNERAADWYRRHGAQPLLDSPLSLVLPLRTIQIAIESAR